MTSSQILRNGQKGVKPAYLLTKEEIINERNRMEANWSESMTQRMREISRISIVTFKTPLSNLA